MVVEDKLVKISPAFYPSRETNPALSFTRPAGKACKKNKHEVTCTRGYLTLIRCF